MRSLAPLAVRNNKVQRMVGSGRCGKGKCHFGTGVHALRYASNQNGLVRMVNRRNLKDVHENAVLSDFRKHLQNHGIVMEICSRPEPPEAMVDIGGRRTWIEITDAFLDKAHAIGLTSGAADDVTHTPDSRRLIVDPDAIFRYQLLSVIDKKYEKSTMQKIALADGPGILLVGAFTPFNKARQIVQENKKSIEDLVSEKSIDVFDQIFIYDGHGNREFHLVYQRT